MSTIETCKECGSVMLEIARTMVGIGERNSMFDLPTKRYLITMACPLRAQRFGFLYGTHEKVTREIDE